MGATVVTGLQQISSSSSSSLPPPTAADVAFQSWTKRVGIVAPLLTCLTTPQSVGGRGLFAVAATAATATPTASSATIQPGTVLASIPHELILRSSDQENWAADITRQVRNLNPNDPRTEWVDAWSGGGCTHWEDAVRLAGNSNGSVNIMTKQLEEQVRRRLDKRKKAWQSAASKYRLDPLHDFALYALVSSRACYLGPFWTTSNNGDDHIPDIGIVPLFDMLNHRTMSNVELMSVGTAFRKMDKDSSSPKPAGLCERDMLLTATREIETGQELFTEYLDDHENYNDNKMAALEIQARKLVQWGFL